MRNTLRQQVLERETLSVSFSSHRADVFWDAAAGAHVSLPQHLLSALISINGALIMSKVQETQPNLLHPEQTLPNTDPKHAEQLRCSSSETSLTDSAVLLYADTAITHHNCCDYQNTEAVISSHKYLKRSTVFIYTGAARDPSVSQHLRAARVTANDHMTYSLSCFNTR